MRRKRLNFRSAKRNAIAVGGFENGCGQFGQYAAVRRRCGVAHPRRPLEQSRKSGHRRGAQHRRKGRPHHPDASQERD